jgi:hypothetical protein
MPQVEQAPRRSAADLRALYRALGVREETLMRAIQFSDAGSVAPTIPKLPKIKRRRGRPVKYKSRPKA